MVLIPPKAKESLVAHLRRAAEEGDIVLPSFEIVRTNRVRLRAAAGWSHLDDRARPIDGEVSLSVSPGAVRVFIPTLA